MTRPVMLTTSHGDGAGVRVTPDAFEAVWEGTYTRVLNWWEAVQRLNVCPPSEREAASEAVAEAEDEARQFVGYVWSVGGAS